MRKIISVILAFALAAGLFSLSATQAEAKNITNLNASISDQKISVSGSVEEGVLAVAVLVYDQSGDNLICMETAGVAADSTYAYTLTRDFTNGPYLVKVADYDGGAYLQKAVTVSSSRPASASPKTGDSPFLYLIVAFGVLISANFVARKRN